MNYLTRFSGLAAALCLSLPAAAFAKDHGGHSGGSVSSSGGSVSHSGGIVSYSGGNVSHGTWSGSHGNWNGSHGTWTGSHNNWSGSHGTWSGSHNNWSGSHNNWGGSHWSGHHGDWHGGNWHNNCYVSRSHYYGSYYPFSYSYYPYYSEPYYDAYYDSPSIGLSFTTSPTYRTSRIDDRGDDLSIDVQRALRRDGYYRGSIDGDIGPGTRAAIRQYQYDHHLEVTGRIDRSLLRSLGLD